MNESPALKADVLGLLADVAPLAARQQAAAQRLAETARRLADEKLFLLVCGEFKRGKSKLVNALLGIDGLCPIGLDVTTAAVVTVRYADAERVTVLRGEPGA